MRLSTGQWCKSPRSLIPANTTRQAAHRGILTALSNMWSPLVNLGRLQGKVTLGQRQSNCILCLNHCEQQHSWGTRQWHSNSLTGHSRDGISWKQKSLEGGWPPFLQHFVSQILLLSTLFPMPLQKRRRAACFLVFVVLRNSWGTKWVNRSGGGVGIGFLSPSWVMYFLLHRKPWWGRGNKELPPCMKVDKLPDDQDCYGLSCAVLPQIPILKPSMIVRRWSLWEVMWFRWGWSLYDGISALIRWDTRKRSLSLLYEHTVRKQLFASQEGSPFQEAIS